MLEELQDAAPNQGRDYVEFYKRPKPDDAASTAEGRAIFKMVEYIRITIPGDKGNQIDRPVLEIHRQKYRPQYQAFLSDKSQDEASGTLLSAWGRIPPERVAEYEYGKVKTVEQLAAVSDGNLQRFGPGSQADREKARDFVETSKGHAPVMKLRSELEEERSKREHLEKVVKELGDKLEASQKPKKGAA